MVVEYCKSCSTYTAGTSGILKGQLESFFLGHQSKPMIVRGKKYYENNTILCYIDNGEFAE